MIDPGLIVFIVLGLLPFVFWMAFIWVLRRLFVLKRVGATFGDWDDSVFPDSLLVKVGVFNLPFKYLEFTVCVYGFYSVTATRTLWYLCLSRKSLPGDNNFEVGFYGDKDKDAPFYNYLETEGVNKKISNHKDICVEGIMDGYSFIEVSENNVIAFYRMPDFFGYKPIDELKSWVMKS
ncbi:MAG: hypothetical protein K6L73_13140 [Cellvibrionaceae bacterium]